VGNSSDLGQGVEIFVVDTGIRCSHSEFQTDATFPGVISDTCCDTVEIQGAENNGFTNIGTFIRTGTYTTSGGLSRPVYVNAYDR